MTCDLIIKNAQIYDGTGGDMYTADIAVSEDRIIGIGSLLDVEAKTVIDAKGLSVMPGFVDTHTHSDAILCSAPQREEALLQGITTEITGSCGIGILPLDSGKEDYIKTVKAIVGDVDFSLDLSCMDAYIKSVGNAGTNYAVQAAHSPIRAKAVGMNDVPINPKRLSSILSITEKMFVDGACALSTGLAYYPASFSDTNELVEMCKIAHKYNAPLTIHLRSALNKYFDKATFDAVAEAVEIAERSGVHLHFSHRRTRPGAFGKLDEIFGVIEDGISRGMNITADFYPYPVGCGYTAVNFPLWVMDGSYDEIMCRLSSPATRRKIALEMEENKNLANGMFISTTNYPEYIGKTYSEVAEMRGQKVSDMLVDYLYEDGLDGGYRPATDFSDSELATFEDDCAEIIKKPYYMVGSDTLPQHSFVHPRTTSTFPKMLRIAREHSIGLEILANRFSALPSKVFGLKDRGVIRKGAYADIVILDYMSARENSDFSDPCQKPDGIKYVVVNGTVAVSDGKTTGAKAGRAVKRSI